MKAVVYIRVSTEDQRLGPKAQQESCEGYCEREGIEVSGVFIDHGVSGGTALEKRDGLLDAINCLEKGDILLVAKRCRLARDVLISCLIEHSVKSAGAKIVSSDGIGMGDGPEAVMMRQILDVFAQYERSMIKMRTRAALRQLKMKGKRAGEIPFGFSCDEDNNIIRNESEQKVISEVIHQRKKGKSLRNIARLLRAAMLKGRKGFLNHVQVGRIVKAWEAGMHEPCSEVSL